jgi:3-phenylpropionate/cinnamic acid dioxygenase small subunit
MQAEDLRAILGLLADYGATFDSGRWDDHRALYVEGAELHVFGRCYAGPERIVARLRKAHRGKHLTGVPRIECDGDRARSLSDFVFFREDLRLYSAGSYVDELVRTAAGWRFASRKIEIGMRAAE